jgi:hypothetical protein
MPNIKGENKWANYFPLPAIVAIAPAIGSLISIWYGDHRLALPLLATAIILCGGTVLMLFVAAGMAIIRAHQMRKRINAKH